MKTSAHSEYIKNFQDFIPITCHYDHATLITRNGELIQVIKVSGALEETLHIQDVIRDSLKKNVLDENFAFWIHTIRKKTDLDDHAEYHNIFSANLHEIIKKEYSWDSQFVNTVYISVLYARPVFNIYDPKTFINSLSTGYISQKFSSHFDAAVDVLSKVTDAIVLDLVSFGAKKLGIHIESGISYSEPLSLFHQIVHLKEKKIPLPIRSLASSVSTSQYIVGNNEIEVLSDKQRSFSTILAIKEYHIIEDTRLDEILKLPVELIITEVFYFVSEKEAKRTFSDFNKILEMSKDVELRNNTIGHIFDYKGNESTSFCNQQISIMVINNDIDTLRQHTSYISESLSDLAIVHVQEDMYLEDMFFAQLPANFVFLKRMTVNAIDRVAGFVDLYNSPEGKEVNSWGSYVALMYTSRHTPYYFNFHDASNKGHTIILGNEDSEYAVLMNFLIAESMKYRPTVIYLTSNINSQIFIEAIGGIWGKISEDTIDIEPEEVVGYQLSDVSQESKLKVIQNVFDKVISMVHLGPKIVVMDDVSVLLDNKQFDDQIDKMMEKLHANNAILVCGANLNQYVKSCEEGIRYKQLFNNCATKVICSDENITLTYQDILQLNDIEYAMVKSSSRVFLLKQDNASEELFLDFIPSIGLYKILSCDLNDIEIAENIKKESDKKEWIIPLYDKLNNNMA